MGLTQVNTSSHLGQSYHVGRNNLMDSRCCLLKREPSFFSTKPNVEMEYGKAISSFNCFCNFFLGKCFVSSIVSVYDSSYNT